MKHPIWTVGFVVVLLVVGIPILGMTIGDAPKTPTAVENESVSIETTNWTAVDADAVEYADNETVYYNDSAVDETEYEWSTENGSIRAVEGGQLDGVSTVEISYTYFEHQRGVRILVTALRPFVYVLLVLGFVGVPIGFLMYGVAAIADNSGGFR